MNVTRARFPAIDFHVHARELADAAVYPGFMTLLNSTGMGAIVDLNGGTGATLDAALKAGEPYDCVATFIKFSNGDDINDPGWSEPFAAEMERAIEQARSGVNG